MDANGGRSGNNGPRVNEQIRIAQVRVVAEDGEQLGIMPTQEALATARAQGLDLVEIAAQAKPPVCKIIDYGKYKYHQQKKLSKQQSTKTQIKELRLRPKTGAGDVMIKVNKAREWLVKKDKVIVSILYRGRELAHLDEGMKVLDTVVRELDDVAKVEAAPKQMGKRLICTLAPK